MNCSEALLLVGKYVDGELSGVILEKMEEHISGCNSCLSKVKDLKKLGSLLTSLPEENPPKGLVDVIVEHAKSTRMKKIETLSPLAVLARIAAAIMITVTGFYFGARLTATQSRDKAERASSALPEAGVFTLVPPDSPGAVCLVLYEGHQNANEE